jgi:DNA mismatch repair protein MSH5
MTYKRRCLGVGTSSWRPSSLTQSFHSESASAIGSSPQNTWSTFPRRPTLPRLRSATPPLPSLCEPALLPARHEDDHQIYHSETEAEIQEREDSDGLNEIIMAIDMKERGTIGCAYYVTREEKLCLLEDIKAAGVEVIDTLKIHGQPTVVLISTRSDERLEEHLSREARGIDRGDEASELVYTVLWKLLI